VTGTWGAFISVGRIKTKKKILSDSHEGKNTGRVKRDPYQEGKVTSEYSTVKEKRGEGFLRNVKGFW